MAPGTGPHGARVRTAAPALGPLSRVLRLVAAGPWEQGPQVVGSFALHLRPTTPPCLEQRQLGWGVTLKTTSEAFPRNSKARGEKKVKKYLVTQPVGTI